MHLSILLTVSFKGQKFTFFSFKNYNNFIEIYFIYHTIHPFNSRIFSMFTDRCTHHRNLGTFRTFSKKKPHTHLSDPCPSSGQLLISFLFDVSNLSSSSFMDHTFGIVPKISLPNSRLQIFFSFFFFSSRSFIVLGFPCRSMIHFQLNFVYGRWFELKFFLCR